MKKILFPDAEILKDVAKDFVGGDLAAGDLGEGVEGEAEVFSNQVCWQLRFESRIFLRPHSRDSVAYP